MTISRKKIGSLLLADLEENKTSKKEVLSLFSYALKNPNYKGEDPNYKGFSLDIEIKKFIKELEVDYSFLNEDFPIERDEVLLRLPFEDTLIESLKIITDTKTVSKYDKVIAALESNLETRRIKCNIDKDKILAEGSSLGQRLRIAFARKIS